MAQCEKGRIAAVCAVAHDGYRKFATLAQKADDLMEAVVDRVHPPDPDGVSYPGLGPCSGSGDHRLTVTWGTDTQVKVICTISGIRVVTDNTFTKDFQWDEDGLIDKLCEALRAALAWCNM